MPVAWRAVIGEGGQAGVTRQVAGLESDGAAGRVPDQVRAEGGDCTPTIRSEASAIAGENGIHHDGASGQCGQSAAA